MLKLIFVNIDFSWLDVIRKVAKAGVLILREPLLRFFV